MFRRFSVPNHMGMKRSLDEAPPLPVDHGHHREVRVRRDR